MNKKPMTLGSLFDGSGGFPLGGLISGITPLWASEVEPFPIRVTSKRIPQMKHLGDISTINGAEIDPVDIITFGSPCQDMSVAGKRSGLDGERSCLFYEAIRIVKEMRCKTNGEYPRYIVWENVPGAFSSNAGEDFKAVLEAVASVNFHGIQFSTNIDTVHYIQAGAVIPTNHDGGSIIHPSDRTLCSNGWCLRIIHLHQFHSAANRVGFSHLLYDFFIRKSHSWHLL